LRFNLADQQSEQTARKTRDLGWLIAVVRLWLWLFGAVLILSLYSQASASLRHNPHLILKYIPDLTFLPAWLLILAASVSLVLQKYLRQIQDHTTDLRKLQRPAGFRSYWFSAIAPVVSFYLPGVFEKLPDVWVRIIGSCLILVLGLGAHIFKKNNQLAYGAVEIVFGVASGARILQGLDIRNIVITQWAVLVGCCYIVARGFNNVFEAKEKLETVDLKTDVRHRLERSSVKSEFEQS
jgi:hypothetical protein